MATYLNSIEMAMIVCPFIAAFLSFFFICFQYKKYGAISFYRCFVVYIFMLFCVSAYFLVILPLPDPTIVEKRTGNTVQLVPFEALRAFFCDSGFSLLHPGTYIRALKRPEFFQPVFNLFLLFPLGCFLRYLFRCNKKKAWIISISVTLFFEITQFTGLYGFYLRPYRLFDVDDIILNSTGSMIGYCVTMRIERFLPKWSKINSKVYKKGQRVNVKRRFVADLFDSFIIRIFTYLTLGFLFVGRVIRIMATHEYTRDERTFTKHFLIWFIGVWIIVSILYYIYYVVKHDGVTLGKKMVGIGLCMSNGTVPTKNKLYLRYFLKVFPTIVIVIAKIPSRFRFYGLEQANIHSWLYLFECIIYFGLFCDFVYTFITHKKKYKRFYYERITDVIDYNVVVESDMEEIEEYASVKTVAKNTKKVFGKITENTFGKVSEETIEKALKKESKASKNDFIEKTIEKTLEKVSNTSNDSSKTTKEQAIEQN